MELKPRRHKFTSITRSANVARSAEFSAGAGLAHNIKPFVVASGTRLASGGALAIARGNQAIAALNASLGRIGAPQRIMKAGRARRALEAFVAAVVHVVPCLAYITRTTTIDVYGPVRARPTGNRPLRRYGLVVTWLAASRLKSSSVCKARGAYAVVFGDASGRTRYARGGAVATAHQAQSTYRTPGRSTAGAVRSHVTNIAAILAFSRAKVASGTSFAKE